MLNRYDIETGKPVNLGPVCLTIHHDDSAESPWDSWDCQAPIAYLGGRGGIETRDSYDDSVLSPLAGVSPAWAARHRARLWAILADLSGSDAATLESDAQEENAAYSGSHWKPGLSAIRLEMMRETLAENRSDSWGAGIDFLEAVADIWKLRGIKAETFQRNGYSQGDVLRVLVVHTPAFLEAVGLGYPDKRDAQAIAADMESDAETLGAWYFGDVYGFELETPDGDHLESCFGFYGVPYGCNPEKGNAWAVLEAAQEALAGIAPGMAQAAQKRAQEARRAFLEARQEAKAVRGRLGLETPALCEAIAARLADLVQTWAAARQDARAWADLGRAVA